MNLLPDTRRVGLFWTALLLAVLLSGCGSDAQAPNAGNAAQVAERLSAAQTALDQGRLDAAESEYRAAAELDPQSAAARFGLGNVLVRQGRLQEAEAAYMSSDERDAYARGVSSKMQEAEAAYLASLKLDPRQAAAHANLGVVYYQQGDMGKAAAAFQEALKINAKDAPTLYLLAAVRLQEGNLTDAEKLLNQARDLDPKLPEVYYGLGALYRLMGRNADAITAFEKFLEIGPGQDASAMDYARRELEALRAE